MPAKGAEITDNRNLNMKKKRAARHIRIFYLLILAPAILWAVLSVSGAAEKLDYATGEKRNKHKIAEGTTLANLTEELELCYNDRVPFRSLLLTVNSSLNYALELPYKKGIEPALIALANAGTKKEEPKTAEGTAEPVSGQEEAQSAAAEASEATEGNEASSAPAVTPAVTPEALPEEETALWDAEGPYYEEPSDAGYYPYIELAPEVIQGRDGWIFTSEALADYLGSNLPSEEDMAEFAGRMDRLAAICAEKGIELHYVAVPNKSTAYPEYMPSLDKADYTALQQLEDYMHAHSAADFQYIDAEILAAKRYGRLYFLTDTHWNGRGAMAGLSAIHRILGLEEIDLRTLVPEQGAEQSCDLVWYTGLPASSFTPEYNVDFSYKSDVPVNMVQGQTDTVDEFVSGAPDGRTLVLVGDSYRHNLMPYLIKDFAHVYFINEKILSAEHLDILNSADILLIEGVERNFFLNFEAQKVLSDLLGILG